jgi:serine/threonine-protein kinase
MFVAANALSLGTGVHFAVAPNGRTVALAGNYGGSRVLLRRDLDRLDPEPIVGTEGASDVFFSHDGRHLGFETRSELWTVSLDGSTPRRLAPNQPLRGGTWGPEDTIVVGRVGSGLWAASSSAGKPRQLTVPAAGERHELPHMLPGGRAVLFTILPSNGPPQVAVHLLESGETRSLFEGVGGRFVDSGHLVFGRQGKLWAVPFDPGALQTLGEARPVRDDILWPAAGYPQFAVGGGVLAYLRSTDAFRREGNTMLTWVDRQGRTTPLPLEPNFFLLPRLSPRGDRFVVQIGTSRDLWTYDVGRRTLTRLTSSRIVAYSAPFWTANGGRVAFTTWFEGEVGLGLVPPDGSGEVERLLTDLGTRSFERTHPVLLPDGSGVILTGLAPGATVEDLLFVPLSGDGPVRPLFHAEGVERNPAVAPDGRFIAYNSDESGRAEVYVRPLPDAGSRKWQISVDGGAGPVWTRGGNEIVYLDSQGHLLAVAVHTDSAGELHRSNPTLLFTRENIDTAGLDRDWDVTADGKRFLFAAPDDTAGRVETAVELVLIQNWTDELSRVVPTRP